ncbi:MAG: tRNA pseudouridine(55) synthase TruB [Omnitrophica WOR_2 bacterium RIFCSPHIGHO2_02_FULL_46_37]|nr:MAG: tRNA pseudouridine(55) synthase TruB [Omnitrophica WOR_2 bacterium RIFCSPHIGHO2_02_FULL_46_37]
MVRSGILLIDKPEGITSHDVVDIVRKKFNLRHIGHAGTLDPIATGLLIILVDKATKRFSRFVNFDKEYIAILRLGAQTDSGDSQGKIIATSDYQQISQERVSAVLKALEGKIENIPPMVSAIKHKGRPLYVLARKGITIERKARMVNIHQLKCLKFSLPDIEFQIRCSKGTYIRSLGEEIARRLDSAGHIIWIRRTAIGPYSVSDAKKIDSFDEDDIRTI